MRSATVLAAMLLCLSVVPLRGQADGGALSARLVTASKDAGNTDAGLSDVLPLLQNLNFKSFRLEGESTLALKEGATATLAKGYSIELTQVQDRNAMVRVIQDRRDVMKTRLSLKEDKPVIVGGFDDPGGGRTIIILKLK